MQLHQLLRIIENNIDIKLWDLHDGLICEVTDKSSIPLDFYEDDVLRMGLDDQALWIEIVR